MANINHLVLGVLILQIYVSAAPSNSKLEDIASTKPEVATLDSESQGVEHKNSTQTARQKRWYNHHGYGFPPINPLVYPTYQKRDESYNFGNYGYDDPFAQIHKRLQEIAAVVRTPPPPPPPHIPIFYPVIFIPTLNCACGETATTKPVTVTETPTDPTPSSVTGRVPELEDERLNWGMVVNDTLDNNTDYQRPISFDPIKPSKPMKIPAPPVEHGTVQDGDDNEIQSSLSTETPVPEANPLGIAQAQSAPTVCDGAILSCCHQAPVIYDCFALQGCPEFTFYGNPCDSNVILGVIEKFRVQYGLAP